ncbi:MAG: phosphatase PAP2 family protein [Nocardioidaceae bacterium]
MHDDHDERRLNPVSSRGRHIAWLVAAAVGSLGLVVAIYVVAVRTTRGRVLDGASLRGAAQSRSSATDLVQRLLDAVSVASLVIAVLSLVIIALLRFRRDLAVAAVVVVLGSNLTTQVLKRVLPRPDLGLSETTPATLNSLPSGHTTVAFSIAVALVIVSPIALRPLLAVAGTIYASATALATLTAGWHRPSDSLAAFFIVTAWAAGTQVYVVRGQPVDDADSLEFDRGATPARMARAAVYLLAFSLVLALLVVLARLDVYGTLAQVSVYISSGCAMAGTATALMAAVLIATAPATPALPSLPVLPE